MKNLFIKSGNYYETPGVSATGAITDLYDLPLNQFVKTDQSYKLSFIDGEYRLYLSNHIPGTTFVYKVVDFVEVCKQLDKYDFVYIGAVFNNDSVLSLVEILDKLVIVGVDKETKKFVNAVTGVTLTGDSIIPVMYGMKMNNGNAYSVILSSLAKLTSFLIDNRNSTIIGDELSVVHVNDGDAIRSQFVDLKITNALKHFKNNDLVIGYAIFAEKNKIVEVDIFKATSGIVTDEFKNGFSISVDSSYKFVIENNRVLFETGDVINMGYLSIKLAATPLYEDVSSREIKETLTFDFIVSVCK